MTTIKKMFLAGVAAAGVTAALPAAAQTGIAQVDPPAAILSVKAIPTALNTINTTYKAQIDQIQARSTALQTQLKTLIAPIDTNKDGNLSQEEYAAAQRANSPVVKQLQDAQQRGENDIAQIQQPIVRARAYAIEQVMGKYGEALNAVITNKKLSMVVAANAVVYVAPTMDITPDVKNELDRLLPSVSVAPPATWQPSEQSLQLLQQLDQALRAQAAQQAQAAPAGAAPAPAAGRPATKPTQGR